MPYFLLLLVILFTNFSTVKPAFAATDPINATVSATATVPTTTATTSDTTAPSPVILVSPPDNTTTGANRPELVWKQTSDPNGNVVFYTVYLNSVAEYLGVSNTGNSQKNNYISRISDNQVLLTPTHDLSDGVYTWMVAAYDLSGNTSYSTTWHFTVDTTAPSLTLTNIDDQYLSPEIEESSNFDLPGPQTTTLTFQSEPWATISLTYTLPDNTQITITSPTNQSGQAIFNLDLPLGITQILATSFDSTLHATSLPLFTLTLSSTPHFGGLLQQLPPTPINFTSTINALSSLPATIAKIDSRFNTAILLAISLAIFMLVLLIIIWKRKFNILILDSSTQRPFRSLIVYHSRPTHSARFTQTIGRILITNKEPILYELNGKGKLYIRRLGRYSTLTIRNPDGTTYVMSLSASRRKYIISI